MKKSFLLLLTVLISSTLYSQTNWYWQNPLPQGNNLSNVQFVNSTTAFAVASASTIIKTTDAGLTWDIKEYAGGSSKILESLYFPDENNGWAGGYDGKLLHTTNAGVSWDSVTGQSVQIIKGISFPTPLLGVIVTAYQYSLCCASIFQTTNGGLTWTNRPLPPDNQYNLYDVAFANDTLGIAVGLFGNILRTTDGGATWLEQNGGTTENLYTIDNVGDSLWVAAGNGRIIIRSTDEGSTWTTVFHGLTNSYEGIDMVNENIGYVCGYGGEIQKTTDGGLTWSLQQGSTMNLLFSISFSDINTGIGVGYFGTIVRTSNGGNTWQTISEGTVQDLEAVTFPDNQTGFVCGADGTVLKTTNLGATWQILTNVTPQTLYGISFTDASTGTAVGEFGTVIRTTNGGTNWTFQPSGISNPGRLTSVSFVNSNLGFAAGYNASSQAAVIKTTDGGTNWTSLSPGITSLLYSINFIDENNGVAVGGNGAIIYTTDSGDTWNDRSLGSGYTFSSVQMVNSSFVVAAGYNYNVFPGVGVVYVSTDGGDSWEQRSFGLVQTLTGAFFMNDNEGIASASYGEIYRTTDGGMNWTSEQSGTDNSLYALTSVDMNNTIIVGRGGTILTSNGTTPVELTSFTAEGNNGNVILKWTTATEKNNKGFEIQRSAAKGEPRQMRDTGDQMPGWKQIGFVEGNGTTTQPHSYSFTDQPDGLPTEGWQAGKGLTPGIYSYRLKQIDFDGTFEYSKIAGISIQPPEIFSLGQNYPNPFNPSTKINYSIPENEFVTIKVYNILGEEVATLVNENKPTGNYEVNFNAKNLSSGIYFYKLQAGSFNQIKRMVLLR